MSDLNLDNDARLICKSDSVKDAIFLYFLFTFLSILEDSYLVTPLPSESEASQHSMNYKTLARNPIHVFKN